MGGLRSRYTEIGDMLVVWKRYVHMHVPTPGLSFQVSTVMVIFTVQWRRPGI